MGDVTMGLKLTIELPGDLRATVRACEGGREFLHEVNSYAGVETVADVLRLVEFYLRFPLPAVQSQIAGKKDLASEEKRMGAAVEKLEVFRADHERFAATAKDVLLGVATENGVRLHLVPATNEDAWLIVADAIHPLHEPRHFVGRINGLDASDVILGGDKQKQRAIVSEAARACIDGIRKPIDGAKACACDWCQRFKGGK